MKKALFAITIAAFIAGIVAIHLMVRNHRAGKKSSPVIAKILVAAEGVFVVCFLTALVVP